MQMQKSSSIIHEIFPIEFKKEGNFTIDNFLFRFLEFGLLGNEFGYFWRSFMIFAIFSIGGQWQRRYTFLFSVFIADLNFNDQWDRIIISFRRFYMQKVINTTNIFGAYEHIMKKIFLSLFLLILIQFLNVLIELPHFYNILLQKLSLQLYTTDCQVYLGWYRVFHQLFEWIIRLMLRLLMWILMLLMLMLLMGQLIWIWMLLVMLVLLWMLNLLKLLKLLMMRMQMLRQMLRQLLMQMLRLLMRNRLTIIDVFVSVFYRIGSTMVQDVDDLLCKWIIAINLIDSASLNIINDCQDLAQARCLHRGNISYPVLLINHPPYAGYQIYNFSILFHFSNQTYLLLLWQFIHHLFQPFVIKKERSSSFCHLETLLKTILDYLIVLRITRLKVRKELFQAELQEQFWKVLISKIINGHSIIRLIRTRRIILCAMGAVIVHSVRSCFVSWRLKGRCFLSLLDNDFVHHTQSIIWSLYLYLTSLSPKLSISWGTRMIVIVLEG